MFKASKVVGAVAVLGLGVLLGGVFGAHRTGSAYAYDGPNGPSTAASVPAEPNTVTVTGVASDTPSAYLSQLQWNINLSDDTVAAVEHDASIVKSKALASLERLKIPTRDIQVSPFGMNIQGNGNITENVTVYVNLNSETKLESVFSALSLLSSQSYVENMNSNILYIPLHPSVERAKLFNEALADARAQATTLAEDVGENLGPVLSMQTVSSNYPPVINGPLENSSTIGGLQSQYYNGGIPGGASPLAAQVQVTFQLAQ